MAIRHALRALALVGTPFRPQGRRVEQGLDCVGLALCAYNLGADSMRNDYRLRGKHLPEISAALSIHFRSVGRRAATAGDLLLMSVAHDQLHLAVMTETGFVLATNPDTVLAPDISFVRRERIPASGVPASFWRGAPDVAVEVLSPDDRQADVAAKVRDYFSHGVTLVWVIDPSARTVTVHRPATPPEILTGDFILDGGNVLAGFEIPAGRLFSEM